MFQTIDLDSLATVTGGNCPCCGGQGGGDPSGGQGQPPGQDPGQGQPQGGGMEGIGKFLAFLQSPQFQQIIGSISQLIAGGGQPGQGQGQPQPGAGGQQPAQA